MLSKSRLLSNTLGVIVATSLLTAGAGDVAAQKARYSRQQDVKVKVNNNERTRPLVAKEEAGAPAPDLTADEILNVQSQVVDIRDDQILLLQALIDETPDSDVDEKAEAYFRLAEAYSQQYRYWRLRTQEFAIKSDSAKKDAEKKKLLKQSQDAAEKSKKALLNAVTQFKKLAGNDKFKKYGNMDKALFSFGFMLKEGKYMKEARTVFQRLIKEYPDSPHIPSAKIAFGDYFFEMAANEPDNFRAHLENAAAEYKAVLKFPESPVYNYALYKMGWVYLNLGEHSDAFDVFFKVADLTKNDKKAEALNRAAKKDLVRAYAEMGKVDLAYKTFQKVDKKYAFDMMQMLGDRYQEQGKAEKAIFTFRELMSIDSKHKNLCLWQYYIAQATLTIGKNKDKVAEIENLVKLHGVLKQSNALPAAEAEECHDNSAAMAGDLARQYHNESMRTLNAETLQYADRLYRVYLDVFPDADDFGETQYYYAELLWSRAENEKNPRLKTELWENAAIEFTNVVKTGKVDAKLLKDSAYAAVLGWKNALDVDPRVKAPPPNLEPDGGKIPEPQPIPEKEQKMLAAFDVYITYIKDPKDDELVGMKFLKANIYRRYAHFDQALPLFADIYEKHPTHETAEYSVNLLLDTLNKMQRFSEMIEWVDRLAADEKFLKDKEDLSETVSKLKQQAMRKAAEELEKTGKATNDYSKFVACGEMYIEIFNRNSEADDADEVLYNAGTCFEQGKSIGAAISIFENLTKLYPQSKQTARALYRLGYNYGNVAYYEEASQKYEEYARKYPGESNAYDAMSNAVFFRKGLGDDDQAIKNTNSFVKTFGPKKPADAAEAFFNLYAIYEKQGDDEALVKHLRAYIDRYGTKYGATRVVQAYAKIGEIRWRQSCSVKAIDGSCVRIVRERALRDTSGKKKRRKSGSDQPTQCGDQAKIKLTAIARDEKLTKEALAAFKKVIAVYEKDSKLGEDKLARYYYALSRFIEAEVEYEKFLSFKFPTGLDFSENNPSKAKKSMKRFEEWVLSKSKAGEAARTRYEQLIFGPVKDPRNAIASAARVGQISQNFSDALFTAEIPNDVRTGPYADDAVAAYCDALTEKADPLEAKSIESFGACLKVSTDLNWFSEWSRLCERELGQIRPEEFPTASEVRAAPDKVAPVTSVEGAILKLP
jgi:tetratricopeptide (TPR) repeat protein